MRLIAWNCARHGPVRDMLSLLAPLHPDLVALQECRRPPGSDRSGNWGGENGNWGAVAASTNPTFPIEPMEIPSLHPTVVPVTVHATAPFVFTSVWTHPPYNTVAWEAMKACANASAARGLPLIAAGDFNSSPRVTGMQRESRELFRRMQEELGLVSAYGHAYGEDLGEEKQATYYHQWKVSQPFHLDYCLVPESWVGRITAVKVGSFAAWRQSDHRPITVDIDL